MIVSGERRTATDDVPKKTSLSKVAGTVVCYPKKKLTCYVRLRKRALFESAVDQNTFYTGLYASQD